MNTLGGYLVKQQLLSANPTAGIERPRFKKKPSKFLHPEELRALLSAECATHERVALSLFVDSMCRVSELVRANVGDLIVSGDQAALRVTVKGGDEKQVPVSPEVVAELQVYLACRGELPRSAPLLVNSRGQGWTRSVLSQRVALPRRGVLIQALPMVEVTDLPETSEGVIRQNARWWYLGMLDDIPYLVRAWREEPTAFNLAQLVRPVANKVVEWPIAALVYPVTGWLGWYLAYHHEGHRFWFYMATVAPTVSLLLTVRVGGIMTKALIEDLHPYLPRRVDLRRKSLKEKFLGSFRCQTYWLLASRGSWRVLWALARRGDYEPGKTDPVRRLSLARLGRGRDAGS
ncbi:MAG: tyrosine-type recombinase/integrase [Candidatus Rokuibacteriota bacterium]